MNFHLRLKDGYGREDKLNYQIHYRNSVRRGGGNLTLKTLFSSFLNKICICLYSRRTYFNFDFYPTFKQQRNITCKLREVVN